MIPLLLAVGCTVSLFLFMRESTLWRWRHTRHHSDTIIAGCDPEIAVPRPPDVKALIMAFFNLGVYRVYSCNRPVNAAQSCITSETGHSINVYGYADLRRFYVSRTRCIGDPSMVALARRSLSPTGFSGTL